ncbi:MAG: Carboxylesterase [Firmicutes bacterium]|nr:Carboxylesterase [Bacillota bacterium]
MPIVSGAEPFFLPGEDKGVLLVHGFTGSPSEMLLLGEHLNQLGYTVLGPRLCGHGTNVEDMARTNWLHWYGAVEDGYYILKAVTKSVAVVGLSMGGLLALKLAHEYPVSKVAALSAPIFINERRLPLLPIYRLFKKFVLKKRRKLPVDIRYSVNYDATPLSSLTSLLEFIKHVDKLLPEIKVPALVIQSRREHTVKPESAEYIYSRLGSRHKQLVWLERSGHIVTLDIERNKVFDCVSEFLADNLQ